MVKTDRECGSCVACCVYLRIEEPELSKPGMSPCEHLARPPSSEDRPMSSDGEENCRVHGTDDRPSCCGGYLCGWLIGFGDDGDRPDLSHMLIDFTSPLGIIENAIIAKPLREGQQDTEEGRATIARISRDAGKPAIVLNYPESWIVRVDGRGVE